MPEVDLEVLRADVDAKFLPNLGTNPSSYWRLVLYFAIAERLDKLVDTQQAILDKMPGPPP